MTKFNDPSFSVPVGDSAEYRKNHARTFRKVRPVCFTVYSTEPLSAVRKRIKDASCRLCDRHDRWECQRSKKEFCERGFRPGDPISKCRAITVKMLVEFQK